MDEKNHEVLSGEEIDALLQGIDGEWMEQTREEIHKDLTAESVAHDILYGDKETAESIAIAYLHGSGWMEKHDKEITEAEYKRGYEAGYEQGCKDSDPEEAEKAIDTALKALRDRKNNKGFGLIELLMAIVIITAVGFFLFWR